jgi:poly-gamma-glutamate synthesis protein (capsule biosynthesis protein)
VKLGLAGDTMLGRMVAERLSHVPPTALFANEVTAVAREADLFVCNLECAISDRGEPWPDPFKPFFFRSPPRAVEALHHLGVGCVTLANNHALDFGEAAMLDTCRRLADAGIECVGAGVDERAARAPVVLERAGLRIGIVGVTDHPSDYAATADRPGVAYTDLRRGVPNWLHESVRDLDADVVIVSPHWGPNMVAAPVAHVRAAAAELLDEGASLVAGHSAHVFHGVGHRVLYDLGDFIDDYARDPVLHNEFGLLWLVTFDGCAPTRVEAIPLALDYCFTRLANRDEATWISERFRRACAALGTDMHTERGRLVVEWPRDTTAHTSPRSTRDAATKTRT